METADLSHHISRRFNEDLEHLRGRALAMGGFVEAQLAKALTSLYEGDSSLGESVALDDLKVNGMEVSIDEECSRILATRAPAATAAAAATGPSPPPAPVMSKRRSSSGRSVVVMGTSCRASCRPVT